jgi:sugar/nucleoside kinase (ribokinase family)
VIKQGEHGAFVQSADIYFTCPAYPVESLVDPTGAGDTFAGGFFGALARMGRVTELNLRRAVVYGVVLASFAVERFGVTGLLGVEREEILRRAAAIQRMSRISLDDTARILR